MVLGDLCTEIDLALHTPLGQMVKLPFLPAEPALLPCGERAGGFTELENELLRQISPALQRVGHQLLQACNAEGDYEAFEFASMNCTGVASGVPETLLRGSTGADRTGPPYVAGRYSFVNVQHALDEITLGDPGAERHH